MKLLTVDTVEDAIEKIMGYGASLAPKTEQVPLTAAAGRILAEEIRAEASLPGFRRSTVDGWAVRARETAGAGENLPVLLRCGLPVEMGHAAAQPLGSGECAYVPTGGMVPEGADAVVMVEYCERLDDRTMAVAAATAPGQNVVGEAEEAAVGDLLLRRGTRLRAQELGVLAAAGVAEAPVFCPWRVSILSIGDELVPPEEAPAPGQVRDVNTYTLSAAAEEAGLRLVSRRVLPDDRQAFLTAVRTAMGESDLVVVSGGSSQGEKDMTARIFGELSSPGVFTHGLAVKPGKPAIFGWDEGSGTLLCGMPGHPVSALIVFRAVVLEVWRRMTGQPEPLPVSAVLESNLPGAPGRTTYQLLRLHFAAGTLHAEPIFGKSGLISTMAAANGYLVIDRNTEGLHRGETVPVYLL